MGCLFLTSKVALCESVPSPNDSGSADPHSDLVASRIIGITPGFPMNGVITAQPGTDDWGNDVNFTTDPLNVVSRGFTGGPLLGNGDIGLTQGGDKDSQVLYISKNGLFRPLGGIRITSLTKGNEPASSRYEQDIFHAVIRATVTINGVPFDMQTWTSASDNMIVTEITNKSALPTDIRVDLWISASLPSQNGKINPPTTFISKTGADKNIIWGTKRLPLNMQAEQFEPLAETAIATTVLGPDKISAIAGDKDSSVTFTVQAKQTILVASFVDGGVGLAPFMPGVESYLNNAIAEVGRFNRDKIESKHQLHLRWWKDFWAKSNVELNDPQMEKFYYGALYALACSNRSGKIAPGLWGNWINSEGPFYDSLYFSNYNFQAPYWGVYTSNHVELAAPFNEQVYGHQPWARNHAHHAGYPGLDEWRVPPVASLNMVGYAKSVPEPLPIAPTRNRKLLNDQLCVSLLSIPNLANYYFYSMDRSYLKDQLYPYLKELSLLWDSYLVKENGKYVINESGAFEEDQGRSKNSTADLGLVRYLYRSLLATSKELNLDADKRADWQEKLDNLSDFPTVTYSGNTVFDDSLDGRGIVVGGNPVSLHAIFPAESVGKNSPQALQTIARDTVDAMQSWNSGNGFPWVFTAAVRAGYDPATVWGHLAARLNGPEWRETNLTLYQWGGGIETFGAIEAINSMLLQSHDNIIRIFPAWPKEKSAKFRGLRAKGAFLVDAAFDNGSISSAQIFSEKGGLCRVSSPWPGAPLLVKDGETLMPAEKSGDDYAFDTIAGHTYILSK
jgi:hypothetical protein